MNDTRSWHGTSWYITWSGLYGASFEWEVFTDQEHYYDIAAGEAAPLAEGWTNGDDYHGGLAAARAAVTDALAAHGLNATVQLEDYDRVS